MKMMRGRESFPVSPGTIRQRRAVRRVCGLLLLLTLAADVSAQLVADFVGTPKSGLAPLTVSFTDLSTGQGIDKWTWNFGDGGISHVQNPTYTYLNPNSFHVSLKVGDSSGNTDTEFKPFYITVSPGPLVADFTATPVQGTSPLKVKLTDTSTGPSSTSVWDVGDPSSPLPMPGSGFLQWVYTVPGTYSVSLTASEIGGTQVDTVLKQDIICVQPGPLGLPQTITTKASGSQLAIAADLDGDGDGDVLAAEGGNDVLSWYENLDGLGSFDASITIETAPDSPSWVDAADLDGDGDADVFAAFTAGVVGWYANTDGLGSFSSREDIDTTLPSGGHGVDAADLDGDGDADVIVAVNGFVSSPAWYENVDGLGTFSTQLPIFTGTAFLPKYVVAADLDGDGDNDVVTDSVAAVHWFENTNGLGSFGPNQIIVTNGFPAVTPEPVDIDADGDLDLLVASIPNSTGTPGMIHWIENEGIPGTLFDTQHVIESSQQGFLNFIRGGDLDADGDCDVVASIWAFAEIIRYENLDGAGTFGPQEHVSYAGSKPSSVHVADLNGDGHADVMATSSAPSFGGDAIQWYEGGALPTWQLLGQGLPGGSGLPLLMGTGELSGGKTLTLTLLKALPGSTTALVVGLGQLGLPFKGGLLVPSPDVIFAGLPVDAQGQNELQALWPPGIPAGLMIWLQHWIVDPQTPQGLAASNALSGLTSP